ncbi:MAG: hypothetical protein V1781_01435 [Bacteroidota bacterium]
MNRIKVSCSSVLLTSVSISAILILDLAENKCRRYSELTKMYKFVGSPKNWFRHCDTKRSKGEAISNSRDKDCFGLLEVILLMNHTRFIFC